MRKCRSPRSLVLGIRNLLWFLVRSQYAISGRSRGRRNRGVWGGHCPPHFWDPEVTGGTMKMIFLVINLCFCKIFSLIDRQRILNIKNGDAHGFLILK